MKHLIISTSLNSNSKSRILAKAVSKHLDAEFIDLQDYNLPICDGDSCYGNKQVQELRSKIEQAKGVILATPIYNFNASASAKNLIELTGDAWNNKIVGFLCSAGGKNSYMSIMHLANSLMLDFRCVILPSYVYASGEDFDGEEITNDKILDRLEKLAKELIRFTAAL